MADLFDSPWKILIIAVVIIVLFGSKKLPVAARSLGRSMRILKSEVSNLHDDDEIDVETAPAARPVAPQQIVAPAPVPPPAPVPAPAPVVAEQPVASQEQIESLQRQIRDMKEASVRPTASVPADQKPV